MRGRATAVDGMLCVRAFHWFLAGFSGSGKSTAGLHLARLSERTFADLDSLVAVRAGRSVQELLESEGEAAFRERERHAMEALLATPTPDGAPLVVALGGGSLEAPGLLDLIAREGLVAWLDVPLATCRGRLGRATDARPLVDAAHRTGGVAAVARLYESRLRAYRSAAVRVEASGPPSDVVQALFLALARAERQLRRGAP